MKSRIELHEVNGEEGSLLFAVLRIDDDDVEMSSVEIYRARSEKHLRSVLLAEFTDGEEDEEMRELAQRLFDDAIDSTILITEIGQLLI